jgi:hypothetical protein
MKKLLFIGCGFVYLSQAFSQSMPSVTTPSFATMQFRMPSSSLKDIDALRAQRDKALLALSMHSVDSKDLTNQENGLKALAQAQNSIFEVCGAGAAHIQTRLRKNSNNSMWWTVLAGITGTGTLAATAINATKGWSVATAASSFQSVSTKEGDASHNSETLVKILADVQKELSAAASGYQKALLKQPQKNADDFALAKASIYEMHNACAFF